MIRALVAAGLVATVGCAAHRSDPRVPGGGDTWVATYRAAVTTDGQRRHRGTLALWAQAPDRLHAELSGPVGGVRLTLDAGGGRACVVDPASRTAYVGRDGGEALDALTGVPIAIPDAVAALLSGRAPAGMELERDGPPGELPARVRLRRGTSTLTLDRIRVRRARPAAPLGTGRVPDGVRVRPLAELGRRGGEEP